MIYSRRLSQDVIDSFELMIDASLTIFEIPYQCQSPIGFQDSVDLLEAFQVIEPRAGDYLMPLFGRIANTMKPTNERPAIKQGQCRPQTMSLAGNVPAPPPQHLPSRPLSLRDWQPFH